MANQKFPSASEPVTNIVLVGPIGTGKSATGNTLLGQNYLMFTSKRQAVGVTMQCEMYRAAIQDGPIINVIDTPGITIAESSIYEDDKSEEIINSLYLAEEGIHAVLFVLSLRNRISGEMVSTLNKLQRIFGSKIVDYCIVVFTGGDELEADDQTLDDYLGEGCPEFLTRVLKLCGERKVLFDNRTRNEDRKAMQLKKLLNHVRSIGRQTFGIPYTYNMFHKVKIDNDKLGDLEAKNLAEGNLAVSILDKLQMKHDHHMNMLTCWVKIALNKSATSHEREMYQLKDTLQLKDTQTMKMMEQMVENALKQSAMAHESEMSELKDKLLLKDTQTMKMMEQMMENALKKSAMAHEREMSQLKDTMLLKDAQTMKMMVENALKQSAIAHERDMSQLKNTLLLKDTQTIKMMEEMVENALKQSAMAHESEKSQLKDKLLLKDTQTMKMMEQMVENASKQSAMARERELSQLKDKLLLKDTQTMKMMEEMVENALKQSAMAHEREMYQLKDTVQVKDTQTINMMAKISAETYEREMHQLKDTLQLKDTQTINMMEKMMENTLKQIVMAHETEMRTVNDILQHGKHQLSSPQKDKTCECNIM